jgi:hypothetical protein
VGNKRREAGPIKPVKGIPGGDCDSCLDWLRKYTGATKGCRAKVADIARDQFTILLDDCVRHLLDLALPEHAKNTIAKAWAGGVLARLHASLEAHQRKLDRENPAYHELKAKIRTRADVLVPKSEISKMVQEELRWAESYQFRLGLFREMSPTEWKVFAQRAGIPEVYWSTVDLGGFCAVSSNEWWNWLWAYILKDKKVLLPNLDPSKHKKQIRGYFRVLVEAREDGTF